MPLRRRAAAPLRCAAHARRCRARIAPSAPPAAPGVPGLNEERSHARWKLFVLYQPRERACEFCEERPSQIQIRHQTRTRLISACAQSSTLSHAMASQSDCCSIPLSAEASRALLLHSCADAETPRIGALRERNRRGGPSCSFETFANAGRPSAAWTKTSRRAVGARAGGTGAGRSDRRQQRDAGGGGSQDALHR